MAMDRGTMHETKDEEARRLDPLVLLRQCAMQGQRVICEYDFLEFGAYRIHKNTRCAFRPSRAQPFIDIGSVQYMYHQVSSENSYTQSQARKKGFQYIGLLERQELLDYIEHGIRSGERIVPEVLEGSKRPKTERSGETPMAPHKRKFEEISVEFEGKRRRKDSFEISYSEYCLQARPLHDLTSTVRTVGKTLPMAVATLKIAQQELRQWSKVEEFSKQQQRRPKKRPFAQELLKMTDQKAGTYPIILVPNNKNAPVNMLNVKDLLQDGKFQRPDRNTNFDAQRQASVLVTRTLHGEKWTFEIRDSVAHFGELDWHRVVAVISDGHEWQFHGWPFPSVVDLLATIKGFYFRERDRFIEMPSHVDKWPVTVLDLVPLNLQHRYAQVRDIFWNEVERFIASARAKHFNFKDAGLGVSARTVQLRAPVL
ncbi:Parafibromin (Cell division cycle protein 73 homolog) (Hyperparathyroidism 2 protein homolog) [Durusdinium trenchii]